MRGGGGRGKNFGRFGRFLTFSDFLDLALLGRFQAFWDVLGCFWTFLNIYNLIKIYEFYFIIIFKMGTEI